MNQQQPCYRDVKRRSSTAQRVGRPPTRAFWLALASVVISATLATAQDVGSLAGKKIVFLGDSITQGGGYVNYTAYYLNKLYPDKKFDIYSLGLSSETLSGLSEEGHAGGKFPRPCLFERLGRLLDKVKPEVAFACYGINDGIYKPLDAERFSAFKKGVERFIDQCQAAGVKQIFLVTPPIYDLVAKAGEFNYDSVMAEYAAWELTLKRNGVTVIDLHTAMRQARDARQDAFSRDKIHPNDEGHLLMARTILAALQAKVPEQKPAEIKADPLFGAVEQQRRLRADRWLSHIGYTREKKVEPQPLGETEAEVAKLQDKIDSLRRAK